MYQILIDDNFTRADTSVGGGANSTNVTGPATYVSPSTGANYIDLIGDLWEISSNTLIAPANENSGNFSTGLLLRPAAENMLNGQATITFVPGSTNTGSAAEVVGRYVSGIGAYAAYVYQDSGWVFAIVEIGTTQNAQTVLTQNAGVSLANTTSYVLTLTLDGSSPTTLTATLATAAAPNTILYTLTTTDSTSGLQVSGQWGIGTNGGYPNTGSSGNTFQHFTTHTKVATTAATALTALPTGASIVAGGTQAFQIQPNGYLASGMTLTVPVATTNGSVSPTSLTFGPGDGATQPAAQPVTLTAGAAGSGTLSTTHTESGGSQTLTNVSDAFTVTATALAIGTLSATSSATGIDLAVSANLSGGAGSGYQYKIYRGTDPNFTANSGSLLATVSSMPYTDTTAVAGTQYYYGVVGIDNASNTVNSIPGGLGSWVPTYLAYVSAQLQTQEVNLVCIGDSITYGAGVSNAGTVNSPTMPYFCIAKLERLMGIRAIAGTNTGVSGTTLTDWAPGETYYTAAKSAMNALNSATPGALSIFSVMLGTNDSAQSGTNNAPYSGSLTAVEYETKLLTIVSQLLSDFPGCKVFLHMAPYYTPNTENASNYQQPGLSALYSYRAALRSVVASYVGSNPGQVFVGDTYAWQYFAQNYSVELQPDNSGPNGTFYLHPSGTAGSDGFIGTQSLGEFHAQVIANALYGTIGTGTTVHNTGSRGGLR